jgi:Uri superfamily endonuclease
MDEAALLATVHAAIPEAVAIASDDAVANGKGAYILLFTLAEPVQFVRRALGAHHISGPLLYVGSARGGGGIAARVGRHMQRGKAVRWHVDELTNAARSVSALALPDGDECSLVARLIASGAFESAVRGFGSSDCKVCPAHLLRPIED